MNQTELQQKLDELKGSKEFMDKVAMCESVEDIVSLLGTEGIVVSAADLEQAMEMTSVQKNGAELDERHLENIFGGVAGSSSAAVTIAQKILPFLPPKPILPVKPKHYFK